MANPGVENIPEMPETNAQERILITVWKMEGEFLKTNFTTPTKTKLRKLKQLYCHMCRVHIDTVRFRYNDANIEDTDTCASLGMENGAIIELYNAQNGPGIVLHYVQSHDRIIIKILRWDIQTICSFYTLRTTPVTRIMQRHCREWGISSRAQRYSYEGRIIQDNDTPASLGMQEGDTLDIFYAQEGGSFQ